MKTFEWRPVVSIAEVDVHARVTGDITVNAVVSAARIATLTIVREGSEDPYLYVGKSVRIAYLNVETNEERALFNGFVRTPSIDLNNGTITLECSDNFNERIQGGEPGLLSIVQGDGLYSKYVFGEYDTLSPQDKFEALLSTTTKQISLDGSGSYTILPLNAPTTTPAFTFDEDDILVNSSSANLADLSQDQGAVSTPPKAIGPVNEVICEVYFRFPRLFERHYNYTLGYPEFTSQEGPIYGGAALAQRDPIRSAINGTGLHVTSESFTPPPLQASYPLQGGGTAVFSISEEFRRRTCIGAAIHGVLRFSKTVTRKYVKIVRCNESIARYGLNSRRETAAVEVKYNFNAWENDITIQPRLYTGNDVGEYTRDITTTVGLPVAGDAEGALITSDDTDVSEALKALEVLARQAEREIIQDNVGVGGSSYGGSSAAQTTSLNFQVAIANAPLVAGQRALYTTSKWQATGTISEVAYTLSATGSATAVITLTSAFIPPGEYSGIVPPQAGGWYPPPPPPEGQQPAPAPPGNTASPVPEEVPEPAPEAPLDGRGTPYNRSINCNFYGKLEYQFINPALDGYFLNTDPLFVPNGFVDEDFPIGNCKVHAPRVDLQDIEEIQSTYVSVKEVALVQDTTIIP